MIYQESETVELKSVVVDDIKKEIIAFANCEGGKLYIGVQDDGTVVGLDDPDGAALQVREKRAPKDSMDEDMVIALAKEQGAFTKKDVEKALGVSQTTCGQLLKQMIEKGQIIQEGRSRNTYYRLTE